MVRMKYLVLIYVKRKNSKPDITKSYVRLTIMYFTKSIKIDILYVKQNAVPKKNYLYRYFN